MPADRKNSARQPRLAATKLENGRASMIPASSPPITVPTTRPRLACGARCEANGTRICVATAHTPTTN